MLLIGTRPLPQTHLRATVCSTLYASDHGESVRASWRGSHAISRGHGASTREPAVKSAHGMHAPTAAGGFGTYSSRSTALQSAHAAPAPRVTIPASTHESSGYRVPFDMAWFMQADGPRQMKLAPHAQYKELIVQFLGMCTVVASQLSFRRSLYTQQLLMSDELPKVDISHKVIRSQQPTPNISRAYRPVLRTHCFIR